jgi:hypothetical protein
MSILQTGKKAAKKLISSKVIKITRRGDWKPILLKSIVRHF